MIEITQAKETDLVGMLELYTNLNGYTVPLVDSRVESVWNKILEEESRYTFVARENERVIATLTLFIHQTLASGQRPFALAEYLVTHPDYRGLGIAGIMLSVAQKIAQRNNCYKIMLITGQSSETVHRLYQRAGYKSQGKTAYVKELEERLI